MSHFKIVLTNGEAEASFRFRIARRWFLGGKQFASKNEEILAPINQKGSVRLNCVKSKFRV